MFNTYSDQFKRNVVAVIKSGYGVAALARRLQIPPTSISNWLKHPKFADVQPAGEELLNKIPVPEACTNRLVKIESKVQKSSYCEKQQLPALKFRIGTVVLETPESLSVDNFKSLINALRDTNVF